MYITKLSSLGEYYHCLIPISESWFSQITISIYKDIQRYHSFKT